jgi:cytochrome oxidase Cu insertion factor (SCO1/SenC/PrrC family)
MMAPAALRGRRTRHFVTAAAIAAAAFFPAFFCAHAAAADEGTRSDATRLMNELMSGKAQVGAPFSLTDQYGKLRSVADFRGKIVVLYFGYTFCPDVCPSDLLQIANLIKSLGKDGDNLQPVFVTLDPERDTQEFLRNYVAAFHPRFVALRGSAAEVRRVATAYKVYFEKVKPPNSSTYFIDHTAFIFLLDREGKYVAFFPPGTSTERMAVMVRELLAQGR